MATILRAETGHAGASGRYRVKAVCFLICLTVSVLSIGVQAERRVTRTWEAKSALHTVFSGHHCSRDDFRGRSADGRVARGDRIEGSREPSRGTQGRRTAPHLCSWISGWPTRWSRPVARHPHCLSLTATSSPLRSSRSRISVRIWGGHQESIRPVDRVPPQSIPRRIARVAGPHLARIMTTGCGRARHPRHARLLCAASVALLAMHPWDATAQSLAPPFSKCVAAAAQWSYTELLCIWQVGAQHGRLAEARKHLRQIGRR